jgi:tRNA (guanine37-N1)-methyltransferase
MRVWLSTQITQNQRLDVPEILLSGNHGEIAKWRRSEAERRTRELEAE